jgi:DNA-binding IclR family transcriptional regulator
MFAIQRNAWERDADGGLRVVNAGKVCPAGKVKGAHLSGPQRSTDAADMPSVLQDRHSSGSERLDTGGGDQYDEGSSVNGNEFRMLNTQSGTRPVSPAVQRALAVLDLLARNGSGLTLSELGRALGQAKSSLHVVLSTLEDAGFVVRDSVSKRYTLGPQILALSAAYARQSDLLRSFYEIASPLARELGETVQMAVLRGRHVLYVAKQEGTQWVRLASEVGTVLPAHATALGKCLLAGLSDAELDRLFAGVELERLTERTIATLDALKAELAEVRACGYAIDRGETLADVNCFGAPIRDATGTVVAAMSISVPVTRVTPERTGELIDAARRAADTLSRRLGWTAAS